MDNPKVMANSIIGASLDGGRLADPKTSINQPHWKMADDDAVGRADRQQVHDHRLEWHQQTSENDHQQQEAEDQDRTDEQRQPSTQVFGEVDAGGGLATDLDVNTRRRKLCVAQAVDEIGRRLVLL